MSKHQIHQPPLREKQSLLQSVGFNQAEQEALVQHVFLSNGLHSNQLNPLLNYLNSIDGVDVPQTFRINLRNAVETASGPDNSFDSKQFLETTSDTNKFPDHLMHGLYLAWHQRHFIGETVVALQVPTVYSKDHGPEIQGLAELLGMKKEERVNGEDNPERVQTNIGVAIGATTCTGETYLKNQKKSIDNRPNPGEPYRLYMLDGGRKLCRSFKDQVKRTLDAIKKHEEYPGAQEALQQALDMNFDQDTNTMVTEIIERFQGRENDFEQVLQSVNVSDTFKPFEMYEYQLSIPNDTPQIDDDGTIRKLPDNQRGNYITYLADKLGKNPRDLTEGDMMLDRYQLVFGKDARIELVQVEARSAEAFMYAAAHHLKENLVAEPLITLTTVQPFNRTYRTILNTALETEGVAAHVLSDGGLSSNMGAHTIMRELAKIFNYRYLAVAKEHGLEDVMIPQERLQAGVLKQIKTLVERVLEKFPDTSTYYNIKREPNSPWMILSPNKHPNTLPKGVLAYITELAPAGEQEALQEKVAMAYNEAALRANEAVIPEEYHGEMRSNGQIIIALLNEDVRRFLEAGKLKYRDDIQPVGQRTEDPDDEILAFAEPPAEDRLAAKVEKLLKREEADRALEAAVPVNYGDWAPSIREQQAAAAAAAASGERGK